MSNSAKQLRELLVFFFTTQEAIVKTLKDKKVNIFDVRYFIPVLGTIKPAFEDLGNPIDRWGDLTVEEKEEIYAYFVEEFDIPDDHIEDLIERTLVMAAMNVQLTKEWIEVFKK